MAKVRCPWHEDSNPSLEVYVDGVHCYVCGAHKSLPEYEKASGTVPLAVLKQKRPAEDVLRAIRHINALPKMGIRGLELPADPDSYYIVWPGNNYYLRRSMDPDANPKYIGPTGHQRPLLVVDEGMQQAGRGLTLLIAEGEINALSLGKAFHGEMGIVSPGSATQFYSSWDAVPHYLRYARQVLIADEDRAGALACINLATELGKRGATDVQCVLMRKRKNGGAGDCNEILEQFGAQALREEILTKLGFKA